MTTWVVIMGILAVIAFFFGAGAMISAPAVTQQIAGLLMFVSPLSCSSEPCYAFAATGTYRRLLGESVNVGSGPKGIRTRLSCDHILGKVRVRHDEKYGARRP